MSLLGRNLTLVAVCALALPALAKTIDMEGRTASIVGGSRFRVKKVGSNRTVTDVDLDFSTRTFTGTMDGGSRDIAGTFAFVGKGGRKLDLAFDADTLEDLEGMFGDRASDLLLDRKGIDSEVTADLTFYKLTLRFSKNKKKVRFRGKYRCDYTVVSTGDTLKGTVRTPMKGFAAKAP